ncbi:hypothetical protein QQ045_007207 [Rhodiola kirilowii]
MDKFATSRQVAYRLELPSEAQVHNVFHVSLLRNCVGNRAIHASPWPIDLHNVQLKYQPKHIVGFRKEVTPYIHELFRSHEWWKGYCCSVTDSEAQLKRYFCMQVSQVKLPATTFSSRPFGNSVMGRELCVANAKTQTGRSLVVATSHLESPCPGQMFNYQHERDGGLEALPELSYVNEMKGIVLPVYPSDHYGLLLTVSSL